MWPQDEVISDATRSLKVTASTSELVVQLESSLIVQNDAQEG